MKTLNKALDVLALFLGNEEEMTLGEIARRTKVNKSTVNKIARVFVERGYLRQREKRGKYGLGVIYMEFSGHIKSQSRLRSVAIPYVTELSRLTGETVLVVFGNGRTPAYTETFHENYNGNNVLRVIPHEGMSLSFHASSAGKILLAGMTAPELRHYFQNAELEKHTANTITNQDKLRQNLAIIKQEGIAYDDEEYALGVYGMAAAIRDYTGQLVGAVSIIAPRVRISSQKITEFVPVLKQCAQNISRDMGYLMSM